MRLRRRRGNASQHPCASCDGPAREWAKVHGTDGTGIWADYIPLCSKCHRRYDGNGNRTARSAETRARQSAAMTGKRWSAERRAKYEASKAT
jgi:hypothetical protein